MKRDYKDHPEVKHDPFNFLIKEDIKEIAGAALLFILLYIFLTIVFCL